MPLYLGSALNPVNSSLIATALVQIAAAMHVSVGRIAVLVSALYLASSIAQPTAGKLSEEFGPRRVFLAGILIVLSGGVLGGAGQDLTTVSAVALLLTVADRRLRGGQGFRSLARSKRRSSSPKP